jgi:hypothetical protein
MSQLELFFYIAIFRKLSGHTPYIHHIGITVLLPFYTSSTLLGRLAGPDPSHLTQLYIWFQNAVGGFRGDYFKLTFIIIFSNFLLLGDAFIYRCPWITKTHKNHIQYKQIPPSVHPPLTVSLNTTSGCVKHSLFLYKMFCLWRFPVETHSAVLTTV